VVSTGAQTPGFVWVSAPGDYATFNSNHTPDGTVIGELIHLISPHLGASVKKPGATRD
jgi:hypothetical protein